MVVTRDITSGAGIPEGPVPPTAVHSEGGFMPWWIIVVVIGLGALTPLCHYWVSHCPPPSEAFTGLRTVDDAQFRHSMRIFLPGFRSPYVLCSSPYAPEYLPLSSLSCILGVWGYLGHWLGADEFCFLGLANGIAGGLYLLAVYFLLREVAPRQANLAFCLHALGGGLAGISFIGCSLAGWREVSGFYVWFYRFAQLELYEGVSLNPLTLFPRIYYTLSLAALFTSLIFFHRYLHLGSLKRLIIAGILAFAGTFINARYGLPLWVLVLLWLLCVPKQPGCRRIAAGTTMGAGTLLGSLAVIVLIKNTSIVFENQLAIRSSIWVSSLAIAGLWHLVLAPIPCVQGLRRLPFMPRVIGYALAGWLAAFVLLYLLNNLYYGNFPPADFTPALWASDKAFAGALLGGIVAIRNRQQHVSESSEPTDWLVLGVLLFLAASIGLFFGGWYLRLTPERLLILASVPLCVMSAKSIQWIKCMRPRMAHVLFAAIILCGVCSQSVSLLYYLGPWGPSFTHMSGIDDVCMRSLGEGTVLTMPPTYGDIIGLRNQNNKVFGTNSNALSGMFWPQISDDFGRFLSPEASESFRREIVQKYCVNYIYCPDTAPVPKSVISDLQRLPWIETTQHMDNAYVMHVVDEPELIKSTSTRP